ncbi:hypothetical protein SAMN05421766_101301 [Zobellia uliginosa]|uniref:Uncharacterized protein n=1 Tax=Zobellia uliginosa TaxID=143224 RepID=A0ABY1KID0_9FLAO|nr:hypothetical protein SAMN05421766_101301 [Zobellia uliginosa]
MLVVGTSMMLALAGGFTSDEYEAYVSGRYEQL